MFLYDFASYKLVPFVVFLLMVLWLAFRIS
jgi:hypothetical protein